MKMTLFLWFLSRKSVPGSPMRGVGWGGRGWGEQIIKEALRRTN